MIEDGHGRRGASLLGLILLLAAGLPAQQATWDAKRAREAGALARDWWKARPKTRFLDWDAAVRSKLVERAKASGPLPEGRLADVVKVLWKPLKKYAPRAKGGGKAIIDTPYGKAWFYKKGSSKKGLIIGLHGGGEGAGSADEPAGKWIGRGLMGMYPQGIRLVHDTWNTVHGERFILTLMEIAKGRYQVDPDRIYVMGFSMGGTGSWFMAGRHPDWLAGAAPCAGVLMAAPKSQLPRKEDIDQVQPGLVRNVRNLAMDYFIGLEDRNCMPGTYLFVNDMLAEYREEDPGGYGKIRFRTFPGLAHAFPPGEPGGVIKRLLKEKRDTFPQNLVWEYATHPRPLATGADKTRRLQKHWFYWLHCGQLRNHQEIRAVRKGNTIDLDVEGTADGVKGLTIFLNPAMIDVKQDVVVRAAGQEVYRGRPAPDLWTVLETMDARLERVMVFDRRIEL